MLISSLSLISCCTIETSLDLPQKYSAIFRNFWMVFGNVLVTFGQVLENFRKSSESREKSKFGKSSKTLLTSSFCPKQCNIIKRTLHVSSKKWILWSCGKNNITLAHCAHLWDIVLVTQTLNSCNILYECMLSSYVVSLNREIKLFCSLQTENLHVPDIEMFFHPFIKDNSSSKWIIKSKTYNRHSENGTYYIYLFQHY